jgi:TfoX/Sxy family transcriptional regulator of competence genes
MEIPKPSDADKEYFRSLLPDRPEVEVKPMFGNLGAFVQGNMFAGLFGPAVGVRLADEDRAELAAVDGAGPFGPAERPMGGYLSLPPAWRDHPGLAADWVDRALSYVSSIPPKKAKPSKPKPSKQSASKPPTPRTR